MTLVKERFLLSPATIRELHDMKANFGFNGLGEVVFRRTYSRDNEDWGDVVIRVIQGVMSIRKDHFTKNRLDWDDDEWQSYARSMAISMFNMEWLPPGRGLWMMGTDFAYERGNMALTNCSATDTQGDLVHSAEWAMDCLMNGVGVGFTTYWRGNATPPNKEDREIFQISDSREGWVESLIKMLCAYIPSRRYPPNKFPEFDYSKVRPAGEPIKGFGGLASGPAPLQKLHTRLEGYLDAFCKGRLQCSGKTWKELPKEDGEGTEWREVNVKVDKEYGHTRLITDIFNAIGACVVAGNVRRSAEICLGSVDDPDFIHLKNYEMHPERSEVGWMSNNSVVLGADQDYEDFTHIPDMARRIRDNGEPGLINLYNIQKYGRYGKEMPDTATLTNPCAEISLSAARDKDGNITGGGETCNLAEVFPPRCADKDVFYQALRYATYYSSTVALLPSHRPETNAIVAKNRRIGISISGIAQWASGEVPEGWGDMNYTKMTTQLRNAYKVVRQENTALAERAGVPASIRVTTVKPSGSISLLAGVTPGVHYPVSRYAIRRMRIGEDSPLVPALKETGIPNEKDTYSDNTLVFEFAIDHGNVRSVEEVSPWEQLALAAMLQRVYVDNSVSNTIYFDKEKDGPDVEKMLAMYIPVLKTISMLPHAGHGYAQAPYEPITREKYLVLRDSYKLPDFSKMGGAVPNGSVFCSGDTCEFVLPSKTEK